MTETTLANEYRPRWLGEVLGQEREVRALTNMIRRNALPAFLIIAGPAGTGKTTLGRILAALMTCKQADLETATCCGECQDCAAAFDGDRDGANFMHIKGGSKGLKDLIEQDMEAFVHGSPIGGSRKRVVLADESQGLTTAARTVLLHMTENLPSSSMIIMTTTDPQAMDNALLTRATKLYLAPLTDDQVVEGIIRHRPDLETDEARAGVAVIAQALEGSMRDVWTTIQKWEALEEPLTPDLAATLMGGATEKDRNKLWKAVFTADYAGIQSAWKVMLDKGADPERLGNQLAQDLFGFAAKKPDSRDWSDAIRVFSQAQLVKQKHAYLAAFHAIASPRAKAEQGDGPVVTSPSAVTLGDNFADALAEAVADRLLPAIANLFQTLPDPMIVARELISLVDYPSASDIAELVANRLAALQAVEETPAPNLVKFKPRIDLDNPQAIYDLFFGGLDLSEQQPL